MQTSLNKPIPISRITNRTAKQAEPGTVTFEQLIFRAMLPKELPSKEDLPGFFPARMKGTSRTKDGLEAFTLLVVDADGITDSRGNYKPMPSIQDAHERFNEYGLTHIISSTASHTEAKPRYRVMFPFDTEKSQTERDWYAGIVNTILDCNLGLDSFDFRFYYVGSVTGRAWHNVGSCGGMAIDQRFIIADDWNDVEPTYPLTHKQAANDAQSGDDLDQALNEVKATTTLPESEIPAMRSALAYLADKGHADDTNLWRSIGLSLKNSGSLGFTLFDDFSKLSHKHNKATIKQDWNSLKGQVTGYALIFKKAIDLGWVNPCKASPTLTKGFKLTALSDIPTTRPPKQWLIKKTLEPRKLHTLIGESGAGKSFVALDMAWHIAHGIDWNGHSVKAKGDVVYIAGEGAEGVIDRCSAMSKHYGQPMPVNFFVSDQGINFDVEADVKMLVDVVKSCSANPALVIIDTLHRNFSADENSAKDIAALLKNLDAYMRVELGAAVLLVHHSGHGDKDRGRGSSAIRAAVDVELVAKKDKDGLIILSCSKAKDFAVGEPLSFKLQTVELNHVDDDGEPVTSAVPIYLGHAFKKTKELRPDNREALTILETMLTQSGEVNATLTERLKANSDDPFDDGQVREVKVVRLADWKAKVRDWLKRDNPNMTANYLRLKLKRLCDDLIKSGNVVNQADFVTLPIT